jgi:hypothetical protein
VCVWSVRAHFHLKRKSFFTHSPTQIKVWKNNKNNNIRANVCMVATAIRTFVSEFVCHPVVLLVTFLTPYDIED